MITIIPVKSLFYSNDLLDNLFEMDSFNNLCKLQNKSYSKIRRKIWNN